MKTLLKDKVDQLKESSRDATFLYYTFSSRLQCTLLSCAAHWPVCKPIPVSRALRHAGTHRRGVGNGVGRRHHGGMWKPGTRSRVCTLITHTTMFSILEKP